MECIFGFDRCQRVELLTVLICLDEDLLLFWTDLGTDFVSIFKTKIRKFYFLHDEIFRCFLPARIET